MSLYDDVIPKNEAGDLVKTSSIKLLQDHLQIKRTQTKNITNKPTFGSFNRISKLDELVPPPVVGNIPSLTSKTGSSLLGGDWDVNEEYDPRWPNDYEKLMKEKKEEKQNASKTQVIATRSLGLDYDDDDDDDDEEYNVQPKTFDSRSNKPTVAIAPPASLLENVEKVSANQQKGFEVSSVAAKIMAKMGYKEGQGLGREEQGINKALHVEKTSKTQGKIICEIEKKPEEIPIVEMLKNPSRVVLLRNMVGPGEVDSELEPETKEECSKYGAVVKCQIIEDKDYEIEEDAVKTFIEFVTVDSAVKALIDLNGRYFGGRIVKASFYDEEKFKKFIRP